MVDYIISSEKREIFQFWKSIFDGIWRILTIFWGKKSKKNIQDFTVFWHFILLKKSKSRRKAFLLYNNF